MDSRLGLILIIVVFILGIQQAALEPKPERCILPAPQIFIQLPDMTPAPEIAAEIAAEPEPEPTPVTVNVHNYTPEEKKPSWLKRTLQTFLSFFFFLG